MSRARSGSSSKRVLPRTITLARLLGSATATSPPGLSTRIISRSTARGSRTWMSSVWHVTRSNTPSWNGMRSASPRR
jgi:hypothetical protein